MRNTKFMKVFIRRHCHKGGAPKQCQNIDKVLFFSAGEGGYRCSLLYFLKLNIYVLFFFCIYRHFYRIIFM